MNQRRKVVKFVDAICGSGKSTTLQHYIKSSLLTNSEAIPPRYLLVMPTHELCGQVREELKDRRVKSFHVDTETEAVRHLISTLEYDFQHSVIICTHQCFIHYCYRAALETELQNLLRNFSIFVDEIPDAMFGAYIKVQHTKRTEQNFPFLDWLEERDGLLFLSEDKREDFYDYWVMTPT
ncbi:DEAD/DEAH box helicase, partial [Enterobacter hormaechei]